MPDLSLLTRNMPHNRDVAVVGDSRLYRGWTTTSGLRHASDGVHFWASVLSNQRARFLQSNNFAVAGATLQPGANSILDQLEAAIASSASMILGNGGTNDWDQPDHTVDVTTSIRTIWERLYRAGKVIIWLMETPRGGPQGAGQALDATDLARVRNLNAWMRQNASLYDVHLIDANPDFVDLTSTSYIPKAGVTHDGKHYNQHGAALIGQRVAAVLNAILPPRDALNWDNGKAYNATTCPRGNLLNNGLFAGTAQTGTHAGTATSWISSDNNVSGLTITRSLVTSGGRQLQQINATGTPTSANALSAIAQSPTLTDFAPGDVVELVAYIECDAGQTGLLGIRNWFQYSNGATQVFGAGGTPSGFTDTTGQMPTFAWAGVYRSPPITIPEGTFTSPSVRFGLDLAQNVAANVTARIGNVSLQKILS